MVERPTIDIPENLDFPVGKFIQIYIEKTPFIRTMWGIEEVYHRNILSRALK